MVLVATILFIGVSNALPAPTSFTTEITKDVYTFTVAIPNLATFNTMFIITKQGVIVIEPFNTNHSRQALAAIREITNQPIKFLLISHNHWDHAGGGKVFKDEGATLIAHKEAVDFMKANPHPDVLIPDRSWTGTKFLLRLGKSRFKVAFFL